MKRVLFFCDNARGEFSQLEKILVESHVETQFIATTSNAFISYVNQGKTTEYIIDFFTPERQSEAKKLLEKTWSIPLSSIQHRGINLIEVLRYEIALLQNIHDLRRIKAYIPLYFTTEEEAQEKLRYYAFLLTNTLADILDERKPDCVVIWNCFPVERRAVSLISRQMGIHTIHLERGFFRETLQMDSEGVNVLSTLGKDTHTEPPLTKEQDEELDWFLADFRKSGQSVVQQEGKLPPGQWRKELSLDENDRIIFVPLQVYHDTNLLLYSKFPSNEELLKALMDAVRNIENVFVIAKRHPESDAQEGQILRDIIGTKGYVIEEGNVHSLIHISDLVAVNNSNVGLEALAYYKPVLAFGDSVYSNKGICLRVNHQREIYPLVLEALSRKGSLNEHEIGMTRSFLYRVRFDYLAPFPGSEAGDREKILGKFFPAQREKYANDTEEKFAGALTESSLLNLKGSHPHDGIRIKKDKIKIFLGRLIGINGLAFLYRLKLKVLEAWNTGKK
jgi:hypothetical protein